MQFGIQVYSNLVFYFVDTNKMSVSRHETKSKGSRIIMMRFYIRSFTKLISSKGITVNEKGSLDGQRCIQLLVQRTMYNLA